MTLHPPTRRAFMGWVGATGGAALAGRPVQAGSATVRFDALLQPAMRSGIATQASMLAITCAGTRVVAVGERGIVLLSDDDARQWRQAEVPVSTSLTGVRFVDERRGWAVGHMGVVLHTDDGGEHWRLQLDGLRAAQLALQAAQADGSDAKTRAAMQALVEDGPDKPLLDVYFTDASTGYVVGAYGLALRTEDGGRHWRPIMGRIANPRGLHLYGMCAAAGGLYLLGEQGLVLHSADGGQSFAPAASPWKGTFFGGFAGRDRGLVLYGLRGRAFRSGDEARTWSELPTTTRNALVTGALLSDGTIVLASQSGELLVSHDAGDHFQGAPLTVRSALTGLVQTASGQLALSTLRGVHRMDAPRLASS